MIINKINNWLSVKVYIKFELYEKNICKIKEKNHLNNRKISD